MKPFFIAKRKRKNSFSPLTFFTKKAVFSLLAISLIFSFLTYFPITTEAAINLKLNYQGKLTDSSGTTVSDGSYNIVFKLYTVASGGSALWTGTHTTANGNAVSVADGLFSVLLGSGTGNSLSGVDFNQTLYLGVTVGSDSEMTPRKELGAVPTAVVADTLDSLDSTSFGRTDTTSTFASGFLATASSTITSLTSVNATSTNATSTNLFVTNLSSTNLTATSLATLSGGILVNNATSTITNLTMTNATSTNATTTNFYVSGTASLGTISAGTWNGSVIGAQYGGTGQNFSSSHGWLQVAGGTFSASTSPTINWFTATSTTATSTISTGGFAVGSNHFVVQQSSGNIGIGTTSPSDRLTLINGSFFQGSTTPVLLGRTPLDGTASPVPTDLTISGRYAYVVDSTTDDLKIFDVSTSSPALISSLTLAAAPQAIAVSGRYAYVVNGSASTNLEIIDISNSSVPVIVATSSLSTSVSDIAVSGRYAYITSVSGGGDFFVVDVANPAAPVMVGNLTSVAAGEIYLSGRYAYITGSVDDIVVIDISNPVSPVVTDTLAWTGDATDIFVSGRYLYALDDSNDQLKIIDISNPNSLSAQSILSSSSVIGTSPLTIFVSGRYAYVSDNVTDDFRLIDVSNPLAPVYLSTSVSISGGKGAIYVSGRRAYITNSSSTAPPGDELLIFDISGIEAVSASIHSLEVGSLQVRENALINQSLAITGGLNVGSLGIYSSGPLAVGVASSTETNPVSASFVGNVGIGSTSPTYALTVDKDVSGAAVAYFRNSNISTPNQANMALYAEAARRGYVAEIVNMVEHPQGDGLQISLATSTGAFTATTNYFIGFYHGTSTSGTIGGKIQGDGAGSVSYTAGGTDYAEYFSTAEPDHKPVPGDLVSFDFNLPEAVRLALLAEANPLAGIVSTAPAFIGGGSVCPATESKECDERHSQSNVLVALTGRVPTKVNDEGGAIAIGDRIAPSSVAGVGKKALLEEPSVGMALEPYSSTGEGKIIIFINLNDPLAAPLAIQGTILASSPSAIQGDPYQNLTVETLTVNGDAKFTGTVVVETLRANKICLGETCLDEEKLRGLLERADLLEEAEIPEEPETPNEPEELEEETATTTEETDIEPEPETLPEELPEPEEEEEETEPEPVEPEELEEIVVEEELTAPEPAEELAPEVLVN